jgi:hypothetical protein
MSVWRDMAHDGGYRGDEAEQVARELEERARGEATSTGVEPSVCAAGSCPFCGDRFRKPSDVVRHHCAPMQEAADKTKEINDLRAENARLRALYENVTGNRERFGWTINHLLECEAALTLSAEHHHAAGVAEGRAAAAKWLREQRHDDKRRTLEWSHAADAIEAAFPTTGGQTDA